MKIADPIKGNGGAALMAEVCAAVAEGRIDSAAEILRSGYPFVPLQQVDGSLSLPQRIRVLVRDGFVDRYTSKLLVFPGAMRMLSNLLPAEFPFHTNWKNDACHFAYWELYATIDHVTPLARGGQHIDVNLVSTSALMNAAKSHSTLEELGWTLHPPGDLDQWDGISRWFIDQAERNPAVLNTGWLRQCHAAIKLALGAKR